MVELTEQAGLPRPEIEEGAGRVVVRFRPSRYVPPRQVKHDLTQRQQAILRLLAERPQVSRRVIVETLGEKTRPVKDDLERLQSVGLVRTTGYGRGAVWFLANPQGAN